MAQTEVERQLTYRQRLAAVHRTVIRLVVSKDVAGRLRKSWRTTTVTRSGAVLAKALDALERLETAEAEANI